MPTPIIHVSVVEQHNMGDHAERLQRPLETIAGETIEDLVRRAFTRRGWQEPPWERAFSSHDDTDTIEIRVSIREEGS